jgi:hypothetical protein
MDFFIFLNSWGHSNFLLNIKWVIVQPSLHPYFTQEHAKKRCLTVLKSNKSRNCRLVEHSKNGWTIFGIRIFLRCYIMGPFGF